METKNGIVIKIVFLLTVLLVFNFLVACGGGGGSGGGSGSDGTTDGTTDGITDGTTPAAATSVSQGLIEGFGSVIVNGVEWESDSAEIEIEGSPGFSESNLAIGMLVKVEGNLDAGGTTGTATSISFDDNLEGPISGITTSNTGSAKTLQVLGQTVIVEDGVTTFDDTPPNSFAAMAVGDVIEVSGPTNFDGSIQATFIEKKADDLTTFLATDDLEIQGVVSGLVGTTFQIDGLTIDASNATVRDGTLANDVLAEVKGNALVGNTLTATDVEIKPAGLGVDDIDHAEMEGFITDLNTAAQTFTVNGQPVDYSAAIFIGGTANELMNGTKVEAEGYIFSGVLQAEELEFEESIKFEANAATVDAGAGTLTLENLTGITVSVDETFTEIEPDGSTLNDIVIGNGVKIRAREGSGGTIVAVELDILDQSAEGSIIQGPVDSFVSMGDVTILGAVVDTTTIDDNNFEDDDISIGRVEFFNRLAVGDLVKARFRGVAWDEIEFED
jgi:Domain of unknown function (DUF5666)